MAIRAVFFDAGETLLSPHPSFPELFARVMAEEGHGIARDEVEAAFEGLAPGFAKILEGLGAENWSTSREVSRKFWGSIYEIAFEKLGIDGDRTLLADAVYARFTRLDSYRLFPDSLPAIDGVRRSGRGAGIISNFEEWLAELLVHLEVAHLVDPLVISGREGVEKPDPAIFEIAIERAGVEPSESVYVGDHLRVDVEAAEAVGMTGVLIDRRERHPDYAGLRITTLTELGRILDP